MFYNTIYEFDRLHSLLDNLVSTTQDHDYKNEDLEYSNIYENDNGYMIQLLAPGTKAEETSVDFNNGLLSISIKRELPEHGEKKILRNERSSTSYTRSYRISDDADIEKVDAKLLNGLLMVHIPKKEEAKPKKISVKVN